MKPVDELLSDHAVLRAKLQLLEGLLHMVPAAEFPLREVLYSLGRCWRCHTEKEELLLATIAPRLHGPAREFAESTPDEHQERLRTLTLLVDLLVHRDRASLQEVIRYTPLLLDSMREHLTDEETGLFPIFQWMGEAPEFHAVSEQMRAIHQRHYPEEKGATMTGAANRVITSDLTVNHVLRDYPATREIFRAFGVEPILDGLHCLDELYWRRGIEIEGLLDALNQEVASERAQHHHVGG